MEIDIEETAKELSVNIAYIFVDKIAPNQLIKAKNMIQRTLEKTKQEYQNQAEYNFDIGDTNS